MIPFDLSSSLLNSSSATSNLLSPSSDFFFKSSYIVFSTLRIYFSLWFSFPYFDSFPIDTKRMNIFSYILEYIYKSCFKYWSINFNIFVTSEFASIEFFSPEYVACFSASFYI